MAATGKRVLHFGLAGPPTKEHEANGMTAESVQKTVNEGAQKARDAGYHVQTTFIWPETFENSLDELKKELESGKWDALVIGGGLRATPNFTPQFERTVNTAREVAPKTKILFQGAPGDILETVQRGFA